MKLVSGGNKRETMVLSRNDKRKRKEGDLVDLMDPLTESAKRTKVHAQRKFAQGAATIFTSSPAPPREKEKVKPAVITELITHKRPNTEDFLTFLCFRGTSTLPPNLNFFKYGVKKVKQDARATSKASTTQTQQQPKTSNSSTPAASKSTESTKSPAKKTNTPTPNVKKVPSNGVKKQVSNNSSTSTVQALKKKYQEQRLAKQRIKNHLKTTCMIRTRSNRQPTLLKTINDKLPTRKFLPAMQKAKKRCGLRSGGTPSNDKRKLMKNVGNTSKKGAKKQVPMKKPPAKPSGKAKAVVKSKRKDSSSEASEASEESSEEDKPTRQSKVTRRSEKKSQEATTTKSTTVTRSRKRAREESSSDDDDDSESEVSEEDDRRRVTRNNRRNNNNNNSESSNDSESEKVANRVKKKKIESKPLTTRSGRKVRASSSENSDSDGKRRRSRSSVSEKKVVNTRATRKTKSTRRKSDEEMSDDESRAGRAYVKLSYLKQQRKVPQKSAGRKKSSSSNSESSESSDDEESKHVTTTKRSVKNVARKSAINSDKRASRSAKVNKKVSSSESSSSDEEVKKKTVVKKVVQKDKGKKPAKKTPPAAAKKKEESSSSEEEEIIKIDKKKLDKRVLRSGKDKASSKMVKKGKSKTSSSSDEEEDVKSNPRVSIERKTRNLRQTAKDGGGASTEEESQRTLRSTREAVSVTPVPRRPSRKTKEAAAVYMELLGRKLISPELDNEDNLSVDSFPELPNARKTAQTENELRAKNNSKKQQEPLKTRGKAAGRRVARGKYCELESDHSSSSSSSTESSSEESAASCSEASGKPKGGRKPGKNNKQNVKRGAAKVDLSKPLESVEKIDDGKSSVGKRRIEIVKQKPGKTIIKESEEDNKTKRKAIESLAQAKVDLKADSKKIDLPKVVADEEEFRGFSKKPPAKKLLDVVVVEAAAEKKIQQQQETTVAAVKSSTVMIIDMPKTSSMCGKKEKVNMSTEQIEKWLNESSMAKEDNKVDMEVDANFRFEDKAKPNVVVATATASRDATHLSISTKIQHLVRPVNVALSKLAQEKKRKVLVQTETIAKPVVAEQVQKVSTVASSTQSVGDSSEGKGSPDKKGGGAMKRPFQPKVKERKTATPSANAFSPENESSVYAFESDNEAPPVSTLPFRRNKKDVGVVASKAKKQLDLGKTEGDKFVLPKNFSNLTNVQVLPLDKLTTSWSNVNCSASIAVQVNLDEQVQQEFPSNSEEQNQQKSTEISTQTESNNDQEDDNDGQLFYIPLQSVSGRNGPKLTQGQQFIQGVAVKLDTEGPTGPNQRVLLKAKLVTKPPMSVARCPPVGTVQPTTRTPSSSVADQPQAGPSEAEVVSTPVVGKQPVTPNEKVTKSPKTPRERKISNEFAKTGKKPRAKNKGSELMSPSNSTTFPSAVDDRTKAQLVEAPTFHPSEKDFQDPLEYIDKIRPIAEKFGICRVVPPANFKPECKVTDDMRFTAYNQYVHRMLHRWGPNVKEMMAIKKYLATQSITLTHPPWIGGMEVDLPHLYQTVQVLGGLKEVIEKKKWQKVADGMKIPKSAQDRVTKLDDIYCKYLLPYDTLSPEEREKLFEDVEKDWEKRQSTKVSQNSETNSSSNDDDDEEDSSDEIEECIVKGRNMPLNAFYRIARNTQRMWFGESNRNGQESDGASADDVEYAFWKHVAERKRHVCVHAASIDSSGRGFGFSVAKNSPFARHAWNLKILTNNAASVLRALGPLMGVTIPTLHVGMLFSACCWYRDPHGLPWIEYLHTGAKKIWYGIPDEYNEKFRKALSTLLPHCCKNKRIWLPSDTVMIPPELLVNHGVSLCQTVQEPGQFIIVFPKAFTSSICTGYVVSESVYFAQSSWLETAEQAFKDIQDSSEPSIFSFDKLLFNIINDTRSHYDVLKLILPIVIKIRDKELDLRKQLERLGLTNKLRLPLPDSGNKRRGKKVTEDDGDFECDVCRANLYVSLVSNSQDDLYHCLPHALQLLAKKKSNLKHYTLMYTYNENELDELIHKLEDRIEAKSKKTNQTKQAK